MSKSGAMKTVETLTLDGCRPTPLASYLKALGVLRLISSDANHVSGHAADPNARGWWEDERFHLRTTLDRGTLIQFFLDSYAPTPIVAPWNGSSGFFPKDNKDGFAALDSKTVARRFEPIAAAIRVSTSVIASHAIEEAPKGHAKFEFVSTLRAELPDEALTWIDAALALSGERLAFPQLLGTGGNDGHLEFTNNFLRRLVSTKPPMGLFDAVSGTPNIDAAYLLDSALFSTSSSGLRSVAVGQFAPGAAGGPNSTTGFGGKGVVNPWDFVLLLEGSSAFAGTATRRHQSVVRSGASFPFTVRSVGAGWGGIDASDENDRAEFWAPLWNRPARFLEVDVLLGEGRAILDGRTVRDGLEFARAVTSLGSSRGFSEFARYGFLRRAGNMFLATPISRQSVTASPHSRLVDDLDGDDGWLERLRRIGPGMPVEARTAIRRLEDALFGLLVPSSSRRDVQSALIALGRVCGLLAVAPKSRQAVGSPPPVLSSAWVTDADDGSPEFRIAVALAGLGLRSPRLVDDALATGSDHGTESVAGHRQGSKPPPMASHMAPVDERGFLLGLRRAWTNKPSTPDLVWRKGSLVENLIAVLERRLVDAAIRGLEDKPLSGATPARLDDVTAFLVDEFSDARCSSLIAGLIWSQQTYAQMKTDAPIARPPFVYAALKPVFTPDRTLRRIGALSDAARMPIPPGLVAHLRRGGSRRDGRATNFAFGVAIARARASGLPSPFDASVTGGRLGTADVSCFGAGIAANRLAAAMLIPITDHALVGLLNRAYPGAVAVPDAQSTEEMIDAA